MLVRAPHRPPRTQSSGDLPLELAARLEIDEPVDRLVMHVHLRVVGELTTQSSRDLLRGIPGGQVSDDPRPQRRTRLDLRNLGTFGVLEGHRMRPLGEVTPLYGRVGLHLAADRRGAAAQIRGNRTQGTLVLETDLDVHPVLIGQPRPGLSTTGPDPTSLGDPVVDRLAVQPHNSSSHGHVPARLPDVPHQRLAIEPHPRRKQRVHHQHQHLRIIRCCFDDASPPRFSGTSRGGYAAGSAGCHWEVAGCGRRGRPISHGLKAVCTHPGVNSAREACTNVDTLGIA